MHEANLNLREIKIAFYVNYLAAAIRKYRIMTADILKTQEASWPAASVLTTLRRRGHLTCAFQCDEMRWNETYIYISLKNSTRANAFELNIIYCGFEAAYVCHREFNVNCSLSR